MARFGKSAGPACNQPLLIAGTLSIAKVVILWLLYYDLTIDWGIMKKLAVLLVAALFLAGCTDQGSDGSSPSASQNANAESPESTPAPSSSQQLDQPEPETEVFDSLGAANVVLDSLNANSSFTWGAQGEDDYEGAPVLIATPEGVFSEAKEGCIVLAWDSVDYDYQERLALWEGTTDLPGQAVWMGASEGLLVELRAFSPEAECYLDAKEALGWDPELSPSFIFPEAISDGGSSQQNNTQPTPEMVKMPNLINSTEYDATTWLRNNGYKFSVSANYGFNPKLSLCIGGKGLVTGQTPRAGSEVKNQAGTSVRLNVDCEWR
ncbi:PASTA domain-containing protein [Candidatus Aquiluna sp. UB-MaderosW2red]|uniref:PASTA domain-containing protein n=1 Tax=Candidatus Aquiluna sp. UB-MaderosW2red TaxID=1855377 RepID=UPI000875EECB|nr:PASTA domain-containing protein [Candidatus Aquiluna sp. UB-MaderosW2red]SCX08402.1 PASTA domain-containing protein [Candidatus Aquiluna sp. UB-MaderosW2red]